MTFNFSWLFEPCIPPLPFIRGLEAPKTSTLRALLLLEHCYRQCNRVSSSSWDTSVHGPGDTVMQHVSNALGHSTVEK